MGQQAGLVAADSALEVADTASPVDAVESVTRELGLALGATKVSFLIADLSGRALVRLSHLQPVNANGTALSTVPRAQARARARRASGS